MKRLHLQALLRSSLALSVALVLMLQYAQGPAFAAGTASGTVITNTASATYTDGNNNNYTTLSNTVTTTVSAAPAVSEAATTPGSAGAPAQTVATGNTVSDPFTITNTGNATGTVSLPSDATIGDGGTLDGYVYNNAATGPCSYATPCSLGSTTNPAAGTLNNVLAANPVAAGASAPVEVLYTAGPNTGGAAGTDSTQTLPEATITYGTGTTATTATAPATASEIDLIETQSRLDVSKVTGAYTGTNPIPFTITANDGGQFGAYGLQSTAVLLGITTANAKGILITDKIPAGSTLSGTPTFTIGASVPTTTTGTLYYTTNAAGTSGWTTTNPGTGVTFVGVYLTTTATNDIVLPADPNGSPNGGGVTTATPPTANVTTAQVTLNLSVTQPTSGSISNIANSIIGGNPDANGGNPETPVIAPGLGTGAAAPIDGPNPTALTVPATATVPATTTSTEATPLANTTASTGTTTPGGASNVAQGSNITSVVFNGPYGAPMAAAAYPVGAGTPVPTNNNQDDFTAVSAPCAAVTPAGTVGTATPAPCTAATTLTVPAQFVNSGNTSDNYAATVVAPAGFSAQVFPATCGTTAAAGPATSVAGVYCTVATTTPLTSVAAAGTTVTSTSAQQVTVGAGTTQSYVVVYTPTAATTPFTPDDSSVTVAGLSGTGSGNDANTTHFDIFVGGPIEITKAALVSCNGAAYAPYTATTTLVSGCLLEYVITVTNNANYAATGEPPSAIAGVTIPAGLTVTEDGGTPTAPGVNGANWYQYTNGINTPGVTVAAGTGTATTFTINYFQAGATASSTTFSGTPSKFTAVSTSSAAPASSTTLTFNATVK
jgi:hypothetical protein